LNLSFDGVKLGYVETLYVIAYSSWVNLCVCCPIQVIIKKFVSL
jgi:hypothetical protein